MDSVLLQQDAVTDFGRTISNRRLRLFYRVKMIFNLNRRITNQWPRFPTA